MCISFIFTSQTDTGHQPLIKVTLSYDDNVRKDVYFFRVLIDDADKLQLFQNVFNLCRLDHKNKESHASRATTATTATTVWMEWQHDEMKKKKLPVISYNELNTKMIFYAHEGWGECCWSDVMLKRTFHIYVHICACIVLWLEQYFAHFWCHLLLFPLTLLMLVSF